MRAETWVNGLSIPNSDIIYMVSSSVTNYAKNEPFVPDFTIFYIFLFCYLVDSSNHDAPKHVYYP